MGLSSADVAKEPALNGTARALPPRRRLLPTAPARATASAPAAAPTAATQTATRTATRTVYFSRTATQTASRRPYPGRVSQMIMNEC